MAEVDVLAEKPCAWRGTRRDDLIFDIGMNICEDTDFYLRKGFEVIAVEANPAACREAEAKYAQLISSGQLTVLNCAISDSRQPLRFYVCETSSAWSTASPTLRDRWASGGAAFNEIEVLATTSADLIGEFGVPYYAKIDIEGFDLICLKGFEAAGAAPAYVSVEVDFYRLDEMIMLLSRLGYRQFALVAQSSVPKQAAPQVPLEGLGVAYNFKSGCSGLFGRELPEKWVGARELKAHCAAIINQYRVAGALAQLGGIPLVGNTATQIARKHFPLAQDWYDIHASH
jgi:FkbM family methyltransferase